MGTFPLNNGGNVKKIENFVASAASIVVQAVGVWTIARWAWSAFRAQVGL